MALSSVLLSLSCLRLTIHHKVICFVIIGVMMLMMMQALGELAVMYPVNGAFYSYIVRFLDPSWSVLSRTPIRRMLADQLNSKGFRLWLAVCHPMADYPALRNHRRWPDHRLLAPGQPFQYRHLDRRLPRHSDCHSVLRRPRLWRR